MIHCWFFIWSTKMISPTSNFQTFINHCQRYLRYSSMKYLWYFSFSYEIFPCNYFLINPFRLINVFCTFVNFYGTNIKMVVTYNLSFLSALFYCHVFVNIAQHVQQTVLTSLIPNHKSQSKLYNHWFCFFLFIICFVQLKR